MCDLVEQIQCEEVNQEVVQVSFEEVMYVTPRTVMIATTFNSDGGPTEIFVAEGFNAKVEQVEMNHIKVTKNGQEFFFELGPQVRWLEEREYEFTGI